MAAAALTCDGARFGSLLTLCQEKSKPRRDDIEDLDEQEQFFKHMEETKTEQDDGVEEHVRVRVRVRGCFQPASLLSSLSSRVDSSSCFPMLFFLGGGCTHTRTHTHTHLALQYEYDEDGNFVSKRTFKRDKDPLGDIDHSKIEYAPFNKAFYTEHNDVTALSRHEVRQNEEAETERGGGRERDRDRDRDRDRQRERERDRDRDGERERQKLL